MKILAIALLTTAAFAQVPCPSSEKLSLPNDATSAAPRACVSTALPPTKATIVVSGTLPAWQCGNTYSIKAGHYPTTTLPKCTAAGWIILKAAADSSVAGSRFTKSSGVVFDHIVTPGYNRIGPGIEIIQKVAGGFDSTLLDARNSSHVVLLRSHLAGTPTGEVGHAFYAAGSDHIAAVGNVIEEIHCKAGSQGKCSDAQGFLAGCGNSGAGFLVENNLIEASTEGILFGGCGAGNSATDAIIERNHIVKPLKWMIGQPNYVGTAFTVKNSLEFKNVNRALVQYNLFENSWGGFTQDGYCLLLTVKNQSGQAPNAQVSNVIVRYNKCIAGSGLQFAAARDTPPPANASSLGTVNASVHDNLFIVDPKFVSSRGIDLQLTLQDPASTAQFTGINISNNSWTSAANAALMLGAHPAGSLVFANNILFAGNYDAVSTGAPAPDCSQGGNKKPAQMLTACWASVSWTNNFVVGGNQNWPAGTSTPTLSPFVSVSSGDFHSTLPGLGANIDAIIPNLVP